MRGSKSDTGNPVISMQTLIDCTSYKISTLGDRPAGLEHCTIPCSQATNHFYLHRKRHFKIEFSDYSMFATSCKMGQVHFTLWARIVFMPAEND